MPNDQTFTINQMKNLLMKFSEERAWEKNYYPNNLAKSVVIEAVELLEHFQWLDTQKSNELISKPSSREKIAYEIVDTLYYLFMLSIIMNIDITEYTYLKLKELEVRYPKKNERTSY